MKVSIIVPVFNGVETIRRCLESIASQVGVEREVLVIDGGSRDGTAEVVGEYAGLVSAFVSEPDRGQSHAINKGLAQASGDILCWLCCDDEFTGDALARVVREFRAAADVDVVSGACRRSFPGGGEYVRRIGDKSWDRVGYNNEFDQPAMFWSRAIYARVGGIDETYHLAMDWEYWNRLKAAKRSHRAVDEVLANYHFSAANKTSGNPAGHLAESRRVVAAYGPYAGQTERLYSRLYEEFDLRGCYDADGKVPRSLREEHHAYIRFAKTLFDDDVVNMYNWNWISRMSRGL